jgi:hypothetical protein
MMIWAAGAACCIEKLLKGKGETKAERQLAREIKSDAVRDVWVELPQEWTGERVVFYTLLDVSREYLHQKRLKWKYIRCNAILEDGEVIHIEYDAEDEETQPYMPRKKSKRRRHDDDDD